MEKSYICSHLLSLTGDIHSFSHISSALCVCMWPCTHTQPSTESLSLHAPTLLATSSLCCHKGHTHDYEVLGCTHTQMQTQKLRGAGGCKQWANTADCYSRLSTKAKGEFLSRLRDPPLRVTLTDLVVWNQSEVSQTLDVLLLKTNFERWVNSLSNGQQSVPCSDGPAPGLCSYQLSRKTAALLHASCFQQQVIPRNVNRPEWPCRVTLIVTHKAFKLLSSELVSE